MMANWNPCLQCGKEVRLRAMRGTVNRKRGVGYWLELAEGETCPCLKPWLCDVMKADKRKPSNLEKMQEKWNAENPAERTEP